MRLVTLTIGGNDLGFSRILRHCYLSDCILDGTLAQARADLPNLKNRLVNVYEQLKAKLSRTHIIIVGYPRIFSPVAKAHGCAWLTNGERNGLNAIASSLNDAISAAASVAKVQFVSVLGALLGHELCTNDSWMNPIEPSCGLPGHTNCGHPSVDGQLAIGKRVQPVLAQAIH